MIALRMFICLLLVTGVAYPLSIFLIAKYAMPNTAGGSLVTIDGKVRGSALIAQNFTKDVYFWPRPSAVDFDPIKPSGGSNLGWTSLTLKAIVAKRGENYKTKPPAELVYASASGLDPHISNETAYFQMERVGVARHVDSAVLRALIDAEAEKYHGKYVNVFLLNLSLDKK